MQGRSPEFSEAPTDTGFSEAKLARKIERKRKLSAFGKNLKIKVRRQKKRVLRRDRI